MKIYKNKNYHLVGSLTDNDEALDYLNFGLSRKDDFLFGLYNVVLAQGGFAKLAERTGLGKESLYKALTPSNNPRFETVLKIVQALGFEFQLKFSSALGLDNSRFIRKNSLAHHCSDLALEWHIIKNKNLTPNDIMPGSKKKVWWRCARNSSHQWQESCNSRLDREKGCPFCSKEKGQRDEIYNT